MAGGIKNRGNTTLRMEIASGETDPVYTAWYSGGAPTLTSLDTSSYIDAGGNVLTDNYFRANSSNYRRHAQLLVNSPSPGASGATWQAPSANAIAGWNLDTNTEYLYVNSVVFNDWDGISDVSVVVYFAVEVAGVGPLTVNLTMNSWFYGETETTPKTQSVTDAIITDGTQWKVYKSTLVIDYDDGANPIHAGDRFTLRFNQDAVAVSDIRVIGASFYYPTAHSGIEDGDT